MFEPLKTIELSGKKYPIKCDLLVLEKIQDKYKTVGEFEEMITTWRIETDEDGNEVTHGKIPNARAVNDALYWMVCEGEYITADSENRQPHLFTREEVIRSVDIPIITLANQMHNEFYRCFKIKNVMTTQNQAEEKA